MTENRIWQGYWLKAGWGMDNPRAPYFQRTIRCVKRPAHAAAFVASAGWHELYVNGCKADDRELAPAVSQYDRHVFFVEYDITALLRDGANSIVLLLGNSLYNDFSDNAWNFRNAPWRDEPKFQCDIIGDGALLAASDTAWKWAPSPIVYNNIRCGEKYDARLEIPGIDRADFDASGWANAVQANPPGGIPVRESAPPCRISKRYPAVRKYHVRNGVWVYDFGVNMTGRCEIVLSGPAGSEVKLEYSERIRACGDIDRENISEHVYRPGAFQTEVYWLNGAAEQRFHSHFTYHGFQFVRVSLPNRDTSVVSVEACFIHTDFARAGVFVASDDTLNRLDRMTRQSFLSNFTGFPTDCPHREKNGWTGDAQLAMETGCWNFDVEKGCEDFLRTVADCQRANGQLPGIAPTGGWGFNWGSGPAWDAILLEYPNRLYQYYGNTGAIRRYYPNFKRYVDYCRSMAEGDLVRFGLGDWDSGNSFADPEVELTSSGYYYYFATLMERFARLLQLADDEAMYRALGGKIRAAFNRKFYHGDGLYGNGAPTALGCALYFRLAEPAEAPRVAARLAETVRSGGHKAQFGILGAKWVPRALADYGYGEDAYQLLVQPEYPGWGYWARQGATTLWENWNGMSSLNHIMFGDISAWMYQYLAGFQMEGGRLVRISPFFPRTLNSVEAAFRGAKIAWRRDGETAACMVVIPPGEPVTVILPGAEPVALPPGEHHLDCRFSE